jgi:hypothetical protein
MSRYRGRSKATLDLLEACKEIIEKTRPLTVRGVCYRLFVAKLIDSMAVANTQKISRLLVRAREEGEIPWEWIVDESRQTIIWQQYADLEEFGSELEDWYRRDFWAHQGIRLLVISEKATVKGILHPVVGRYGVNFLPVHGFNSATKMYELAQSIANDGRRTVILYVGDYDPSGLFMSEMDLPQRLRDYGAGGYSLYRIALDAFDVRGLPSFPVSDKKKDPRYSWFVERYGQRAWELDAMDPNNLRERVEDWIKRFIDSDEWEHHKKIEAAQRETTKRIAQAMAGAK